MAKRNADQMFERLSPVSGERSPACASVLGLRESVSGCTHSGNFRRGGMACAPKPVRVAMLNRSSISDVVTEL